jgi:hypothetical protein
MKALIITLITGIVLSQLGISVGASSENSASRDLAAAKSLAFGGVGVAGLMSEGERNLRAVLERPDASQQLQAALAHATPAGTLYILVGLRRCDRAAYQKVFDSLARPSDDLEVVRGCMISKEPFVSSSHRFKMADSMITCHGRRIFVRLLREWTLHEDISKS